jgi:hypothetical protein
MAPRKEKADKSTAQQGKSSCILFVTYLEEFPDDILTGSSMVLEYLRSFSPHCN